MTLEIMAQRQVKLRDMCTGLENKAKNTANKGRNKEISHVQAQRIELRKKFSLREKS
jgi:hypothetical protein